MQLRFAPGLVMTIAAAIVVTRRMLPLYRLARAGQPAEPGRTAKLPARWRTELVTVRPTPSPAAPAPTPDLSGGTA